MKRMLAASASALALVAAYAAPAYAGLFDRIVRDVEDTASTVGEAVENTVEDVADVVDDLTGAPEPGPIEISPIRGGPYEPIEPIRPPGPPGFGPGHAGDPIDQTEANIEWMQSQCPTRGQSDSIYGSVGLSPGQRLLLAFCRVATDSMGDVVDVAQVANNAGAAMLAEIASDLDALFSGDRERQQALVDRWSERFDRVEPLIALIVEEHFSNTQDGADLIDAIQTGDLRRVTQLAWRNEKTYRALRAAQIAGFETMTIGVGLDASLVAGALGELGVALDIDEVLEGRVGASTYYVTAGGTFGASVAAGGAIGVGAWTAEAPDIGGPSWGGMAAVESGVSIGGGVWFDQDETANEGAGNFIGLSVGGGIGLGLEVGELARTATAVGSFEELTTPSTLLARLYDAARM